MSHRLKFRGGFRPCASQFGTSTNTSLNPFLTASRPFPNVARPATCTSRLILDPFLSEPPPPPPLGAPMLKEGLMAWASKDSTSKRGGPCSERSLW